MKKTMILGAVLMATSFATLHAGFGFFWNFGVCPPPVVVARPAPVVVVAPAYPYACWDGYYVHYRPCCRQPAYHRRVEVRTPCHELVESRQIGENVRAPRRAL